MVEDVDTFGPAWWAGWAAAEVLADALHAGVPEGSDAYARADYLADAFGAALAAVGADHRAVLAEQAAAWRAWRATRDAEVGA